MENKLSFCVWGKYALFTDPITKVGGEKFSYQIPTYEALKGIISSVYWKPTFIWVIDKVRIINPISTEAKNIRPIEYSGGNTLAIYTYLKDVKYQVQVHFEWNLHRQDLENDRNENKHYFVAKRMIERGGRRDIFLGTRECQGYVESCVFNEGEGFYDSYPPLSFDLMFHGFDYPDEIGKNELHARFWRPVMNHGVIEFEKPQNCTIRKKVRSLAAQPPISNGLEDDSLAEFTKELGIL